jgi:hypothetical protein
MTGNELLWRVVGYDTRKMMNQQLLYLEDTKDQAYSKATRLNPSLDVYFVARVDDNDTSWRNYG